MGESKAICVAAFWWIAQYLWLLWQMSQHSVSKTILNVITPFRLIAEPATGPHHGHQNPSVIALHFGKQINYLSLFFVRLQFFRFFLTCPLSEDPWLMAVSSAKEGRSLFCVHCGFHFHFLFLCDAYTGPTPGCCCLSPHGLDRANYVIISFDYFVWLMLMGNSARKERGGECDRSLQWHLFSCHFAALPAPPTVYLLACSCPAGLCFGWFLVRFRSRFRFECNCIIMMNALLIEGKFGAHTEPGSVPLSLSHVTWKERKANRFSYLWAAAFFICPRLIWPNRLGLGETLCHVCGLTMWVFKICISYSALRRVVQVPASG